MDSDMPPTDPEPRAATFTIILQGTSFVLSQDQYQFDAPNFFTAAFDGEFAEATTRTLSSDHSPILFRFIADFLSGYQILPLPPIPSMTPATALRNLLLDARYFGLSKLERLLDASKVNALQALGFARKITLEDLTSGLVRFERDPRKWTQSSGSTSKDEASGKKGDEGDGGNALEDLEDFNVEGEGEVAEDQDEDPHRPDSTVAASEATTVDQGAEGTQERAVPLMADFLPPLIRVSNVNLKIRWLMGGDDKSATTESLWIWTPALDAEMALPNSVEDQDVHPPLSLCESTYAASVHFAPDVQEYTIPSTAPLLRIDGLLGDIKELRRAVSQWASIYHLEASPAAPGMTSPFAAAIFRHLDMIHPDMGHRHGEDSKIIYNNVTFGLFANELIVTPTSRKINGGSRLDEVDLSMLGLFILDTFEWRDPNDRLAPPLKRTDTILGGGGTYAIVGARMWLAANEVGIVVDRGNDFPREIQQELDAMGPEMWHFRDQDRPTTRALNLYTGEHRDFKYLSPRLRLTPADLPPSLASAKALHLCCSSSRTVSIISELPTPPPLIFFEPIPDSCIPENLPTLLEILPLLEVFSPNHEEASGFFGIGEEEVKARGKKGIEDVAARFLERGARRVVVRSGAWGAWIVEKGSDGMWVDAYHKDASKVVDVTGAGNSFVGGLIAGLSLHPTNILLATQMASVSASFIIEQFGLAKFERGEDGKEMWNGEAAEKRLREMKAR
ncbi:hypothetical protein P7C70_g957, partial [Phenoliferia sp. Uapishka_3]